MEIVTTMAGVDAFRPRQGICDLAKAGFRNIVLDLSLLCSPSMIEKAGRGRNLSGNVIRAAESRRIDLTENPAAMFETCQPIVSAIKDQKLNISLAKAPCFSRKTKRLLELQCLMVSLAEESIRVASDLKAKFLLVPPLLDGEARDFGTLNLEYYRSFIEPAKSLGVTVLIPNQCKYLNGHYVRGFCMEERDMVSFLDRLNHEAGTDCFGFALDVGEANLCGKNLYDMACVLGKYLKVVLLADGNGSEAQRLLPFSAAGVGGSKTDWLNLIRGLRKAEFDGQLVLDMKDTVDAFSPLLRPELLKLGKSAAEYMKWQIFMEALLKKYPKRVLFGAGNMCRNYMKCYGTQYPPLFTCDNNKSLWDTEFCGIMVRSPENLKAIPEDCAIFICNVYYREIEEQLHRMGLKNPIEYFNDEYAPMFCFDRLKEV